MSTPIPPRGMRDFLPAAKARREFVLRVIREVYASYGFGEVEAPALEEIARLQTGDAGGNQKMVFNVLRRRLRPAEIVAAADDPARLINLGLRYDLTVPLARLYATNRGGLPAVVRMLQVGPVWRAERPQRGRYRQFTQVDVDVFGEPGMLAEAELVQAAGTVLERLGVTGWQLRVNSRVLLDTLLDMCGVPVPQRTAVLVVLDKFDKVGQAGVARELAALALPPAAMADLLARVTGFTEAQVADQVGSASESQLADLAPALRSGASDIAAFVAALPADLQARVVFDPLLVRGLGYYTGLIYELVAPGGAGSIGGGGRYDGLVGRLAGVDVPAAGLSLGFERLIDLVTLTDAGQPLGVVLVYDADVPVKDLLVAKQTLVDRGYRVLPLRRPRQLATVLDRLQAEGYTAFATLRATQAATGVDVKPLGSTR